MKKKPLTSRQAWLEIARRIAKGDWEQSGMCYEVGVLWCEGIIDSATEAVMREAIKYHMGNDGLRKPDATGPWAFLPEDDAAVRVLAALFLAEEAQ